MFKIKCPKVVKKLIKNKNDDNNNNYRECQEELRKAKMSPNGPDFEEEGPYSNIPEDEFFDAVETGLEKIEEVQQIRVKLKLQNQQSQIESGQIVIESVIDDFGTGNHAKYHALWPEIDNVCNDQLKHALEGVSDDGWQIFADEGEMKMYRVRSSEISFNKVPASIYNSNFHLA